MASRCKIANFARMCQCPPPVRFRRALLWCAPILLIQQVAAALTPPSARILPVGKADVLSCFSAASVTPTGLPIIAALWGQPQWVLLIGIVLLMALGALVSYLLYKQRQLERFRVEHLRLSGMLINAQEEERKRLASELHDDFSQRLALLSLAIETAAEAAPASMQEQMRELLNSASELGADLHTLSHRLHSATLEKLGLVPGVGAFCKEFTAQQNIPVAFSHLNVPRSVEPEVALCLFRVVQEGLRNVKKHSGASKAEVTLNASNGHIHLSIADDGGGFDASQLAINQGLGIFSMEERARLVGARFAIQSEPQKGTRIDVWAPRNDHPRTFAAAVRMATTAGGDWQ